MEKYIKFVFTCKHNMPRIVKAVTGGKINIIDNVLEIYEKKVTPYGNGAKVDAQKKHIGRRAYIIILKD